MLRLALTINFISILWFFIFLQYDYVAYVIGISIVIWFFVYLKKRQDKLEIKFQKQFHGKNIRYLDKCAVFRAQESHRYSQTEGKGYLVLTDEELYFEMVLLNKVLVIPVTSIKNVGQTNRLLGVNPGRAMLKVEFVDSAGKNDAMALTVKELATWKKEIAAAMSKYEK